MIDDFIWFYNHTQLQTATGMAPLEMRALAVSSPFLDPLALLTIFGAVHLAEGVVHHRTGLVYLTGVEINTGAGIPRAIHRKRSFQASGAMCSRAWRFLKALSSA